MKDNGADMSDIETRTHSGDEMTADDARLDAQFSVLVKKSMVTPPDGLRKQVLSQIRAEKAKKRKMIYGIGAAAAAFVVVVGVVVAVRVGTASNKDMSAGGNNDAEAVVGDIAGKQDGVGDDILSASNDGALPSEGLPGGDMSNEAAVDKREDAMYWLGMYGATGGVVAIIDDDKMSEAAASFDQPYDDGDTIFSFDYTDEAMEKLTSAGYEVIDARDELEEDEIPIIIVVAKSRFD